MDHPLKHVFEWFLEVNPSGYGYGPIKVSYQEIEAFSRVRKITIRPWEAELIVDISIANIEVWNYYQNNPNLPKGYTPVSGAQGIKAMFSKIAQDRES